MFEQKVKLKQFNEDLRIELWVENFYWYLNIFTWILLLLFQLF